MSKAPLDQSLVSQRLVTRCPWVRLVRGHEELASTQKFAMEMAATGASEGSIVIATRQNAGRGRGRHTWFSPPGGLYASMVLRPGFPVEKWPSITFAAAAGIAATMRRYGVDAALKWPNDVNIEGRKVAGCLATAQPQQGFVVLGVGINLLWPADVVVPADLRPRITSLYEHSQGNDLPAPEHVAADMVCEVLARYMALRPDGDSWVTGVNSLLDRKNPYVFKDVRGFQEDVLPDFSLSLREQDNKIRVLGMDYAVGD